jgi:hypothetical protein
VLFDQFIATADGHARYAQAPQQVNFPTDEAFQAAYLEFFQAVAEKIPVPLVVNMEGASIVRDPGFVAEVALAAGGVENEIFPEEMPVEDLRPYLETVENLPADVHVRINSKPAGFAGDIDNTLFAYYCYLLLADPAREVYWTHKEGTSDIPHYWYREFDLELDEPQGKINFGESIWSREYANAVVVVNPGTDPADYTWSGDDLFYDVEGNLLQSPVTLDGRSTMLLVRDPAILPPIVSSVLISLQGRGFHFDFLVLAELLVIALIGGLLLFMAAMRKKSTLASSVRCWESPSSRGYSSSPWHLPSGWHREGLSREVSRGRSSWLLGACC